MGSFTLDLELLEGAGLPGTLSQELGTDFSLCQQVFEDKQHLWVDALDELKQMYVAKLQQVTQQAQRSQRALQLQLYKAQQEKKRLQEELSLHQGQCEELRQWQQQCERVSPKLEETRWEVSKGELCSSPPPFCPSSCPSAPQSQPAASALGTGSNCTVLRGFCGGTFSQDEAERR